MVQEALALRRMGLKRASYAPDATYLSGICCFIDVLLLPKTCVMEMKWYMQGRSEIYFRVHLNGGLKRQLNNDRDIYLM